MSHASPELLEQAVYGLPELNRDAIRDARLVANPGCYPTAVTLGFLPLIKHKIVDPADLVADAKSGVSGAGRGANVGTLMAEAADSLKAYGVSGHRHHPEIVQTLTNVAGEATGLVFTPHLTPMIRGIHATLYANLNTDAVPDLQELYEDFYSDEPFVDILPAGSHPETRSVRGSNFCRIAAHRHGNKVIVLSTIDNLVKGASGQAVQNFNLMFGIDETTGLNVVPLMP
jgi:N-acetyl-gamma-glutamyl-phosphate reductase